MSYRRLIGLFALTFLGASTAAGRGAEFSDEWLKLVHYRANLFGGYRSSVRGQAFFLSAEGPRSPEKEFVATVEKMFSGPREERLKTQCAYLARRDFLVSIQQRPKEDVLECEEFERWFKKLNPTKISLVFASGFYGAAASSFGHVLLKLHSPENEGGRDLLNYGINYAAQTKNIGGALYAWYGLLGFFPGSYGMAPYHHLIKEYTNMEGRDLWEYELSFTPAEIERLMKHLLELERGHFDYYFLDENCAAMIAQAFAIARPDLDVTARFGFWFLPMETLRFAVRNGLAGSPKFRASLQTEFETSYARLSLQQKLHLRSMIRGFESGMSMREGSAATATLLAAQNYYSLQAAFDFPKYAAPKHALSLEMAKRDDVTVAKPVATEPAPDSWPGASRLSVGAIRRAGADRARVQFRFVGHDLLDAEVGVAPFSAFELGAVAVEPTRSEFKVVNFLRTRSVSWIEAPLSWGFTLERTDTWHLPLRAGYTFDLLGQARWMSFLRADLQEAVDDEKALATGWENILAVHLHRTLRVLIFVGGRFSSQGRIEGGLAWEPLSGIEFRYERVLETDRLSLAGKF